MLCMGATRRLTHWSLAAGLLFAVPLFACGGEPAPAKPAPLLAGVVSAFDKLPSTSESVGFTLGETMLPRGGHLQGIQVRFDAAGNRNLAYLTHDSDTVAYLLIVEFVPDFSRPGRVVGYQEFPSDGRSPPLRHAGGIQLLGDVLAVGLEDNQNKTRSEVQFWDVATAEAPVQLKHLTISRSGAPKDLTSGAVGLVRRGHDHVLAVANWDSRAVDFYLAPQLPLSDPACRFKFHARWRVDSAKTSDWRRTHDLTRTRPSTWLPTHRADCSCWGSIQTRPARTSSICSACNSTKPPTNCCKSWPSRN